ncbi:hypothetical protein MASR2M74_05530 [Paracoccaceae bacterium]
MAYAETYARTARHASAVDLLCADDHPLQEALSGGFGPEATARQLRRAAASDLIEARRYYLITLLVATSTLTLHLFRLIG